VRLTATGAAVIEVNPRLAGGMIPALVAHATGIDLLEQQVRVAAGLPPDLTRTRDQHAGIQFLLTGRPGTLSRVDGLLAARQRAAEVTITAKPGTAVRPARSGYDRLGHVIAHGDDHTDVTAALTAATAALEVVVHGDTLLDEDEVRAA
jgi:S-sulfo-L-cysteine synthase (3-phospho-L-serine-dependent)